MSITRKDLYATAFTLHSCKPDELCDDIDLWMDVADALQDALAERVVGFKREVFTRICVEGE